MKRSVKILALSIISFCSLGAATVSTIAWFSADTKTDFVDGGAVASYFKSGDGTEEDPYIISSRNHVYNLAWLQYIGYFNAERFGGIQQKYFEVENDVDMEGLVIPPIGTEIYPFLGHFDGNGHTISNFTISNDDPEQDDSDFGVAKPVNLYDGEQPEIVGFFGVVGKLPNQSISYSSSVVDIHNVTLKEFEVKSETSSTLIGLAAGYVDGTMSGVKVDGEAKLNLGSSIKSAKSTITENLTDYALVGYSAQLASDGSYSQEISKWYDSNLSEYGGEDLPALGGSMDVRDLYNRLDNIKSNYATTAHYIRKQTQTIDVDGNYSPIETSNIAGTNNVYDYADIDNYVGSFSFSADENDGLPISRSFKPLHLTGRRYAQLQISDNQNSTRMVFFNSTYYSTRMPYLAPVNNTSTGVRIDDTNALRYTEPPTVEYGWNYTDASFDPGIQNNLGNLYSVSNDTKYYLKIDSYDGVMRARQVILDSAPDAENFKWHLEDVGTNYSYTYDDVQHTVKRYYLYSNYGGNKYYLGYYGNLTTNAGKGSRGIFVRNVITPTIEYQTSSLYDNYESVLPLITKSNSDHSAKDVNTGYIVSSSEYEPRADFKNSGSIQTAWYSRSGTEFTYDADVAENQIMTIYGGTSSNVLANSISNYQEFHERYVDFSPSLDASQTGNKFYSLKFNEVKTTVSSSNVATIPKAVVNTIYYQNYQLPRNAVNFSLSGRGHTIFFAGTFVGDSGTYDSFFSLHKVNRSGVNVTSTEEIKQIYRHKTSQNANYVYVTSSNATIPDLSVYELVFDTSWITNPTSITNDKIYYFEIPLNAGDYALGGVPNKNSAHLMYLDIGTNGSEAVDSITGYTITTHKSAHSYPIGVDFAVINANVGGGDSICVSIGNSNQGYVEFDVATSVIAILGNIKQDSTALSRYSYQGRNYSNSSATGKFIVTGNSPDDLPPASTISERKSFATVKLSTGQTYSIVITDVINGNHSIASTVFLCDGVVYNDLASLTAIVRPFTSSVLGTLRGLDKAITLTRTNTSNIEFNVTPTYSIDNRKDVIITMDVTGVSVIVSDIDDYSFYKNSISQANRMTNGNTYTF